MSVVAVAWEGHPANAPGRTASRVTRKVEQRRRFGLRFVAVSLVLSCVVLGVLLALAAFHTRLAAGQYRLVELETAVAEESEILIGLQVELRSYESPAQLEVLAEGALGLVTAEKPVNLKMSADHISSASSTLQVDGAGVGTDWLLLKELLGGSAATRNR